MTNADYIFFLRYKRVVSGFSVRIEAAAEQDVQNKSDENVCESTITVKSILPLDTEYAVPLALTEFANQFPFGSTNPYHFAHEIGLTNSTP